MAQDPYAEYAARHGGQSRPSDYRERETRARDSVQAQAEPHDESPPIPDVDIKRVELRGAFPRTQLVVLFHWARYPGQSLGRARQLWDFDGTFDPWVERDFIMSLRLDLKAKRKDLEPRPDSDGTWWL